MIGGIYVAAAAFASGAIGAGAGPGTGVPVPGGAFHGDAFAADTFHVGIVVETETGITIDGIDVVGRVRVNGLTIRDVLNDAPNTCTLTMEGDGPAVGQRIRITIDEGLRVLFAGPIQTVDQSYESRPDLVAWHVTAIDDTAIANQRRPFGTWFETSATTIAQAITTTYAPTFSAAGIEGALPPVTIVFDGADPFIACLARLATAVGGYCKIEDGVVYLFTVDLTDPPDPIDEDHCFLASPPIQMNVDASQLRTRVYGKGYGETVPTDINAGETQIPITDGALFPPLGGTAIVGLTPEGAQSETIAFTGVVLKSGGSLVGTGASPTNPPVVALAGGAGVTSGEHTLSVAYRTATGPSMASPPATITAGVHAPPDTAPVAATAVNGTGPDQGSHDYAVEFVTAYGVTGGGPISNAITTSAASGQLPAPGPPTVDFATLQGTGAPDGYHDYKVTFTNPTGETAGSSQSNAVLCQSQLVGTTDPVQPNAITGTVPALAGGNMDTNQNFSYWTTHTTALGETVPPASSLGVAIPFDGSARSANIPLYVHPDPRVTGRKLYRLMGSGGPSGAHLCATIPNNTATNFYDTQAQASIASNPPPPTVDTTANPGTPTPFNRINLTYIPTGPAGTTGRKLYRRWQTGGDPDWFYVFTLSNNTATTHVDTATHNNGAAVVPSSNTTGTAVQRIPVSAIPIGPASVTGRNLYRRFNGAGPFKLVTTIGNNTGTTFNDSVANAALGAALGAPTAVGNQILVTLPTGPAAVTTRELYMSPITGPRRLIQTIADNTTTAVTVTIADAAITGALEPTADTSGLQQPQGQINPGAVALPVASSAAFRSAGGWVVLGGGQVVKHTGINGNLLTGIPATGSGAITTAVLYGQQAIPSPMLVGVSGLTRPMLKGSAVHIWIQRDDLLAQAEHAARTGGDGIVEYLLVDNRRGVESLAARCEADLALFSRPIVTVSYATRDLKTRSGKQVAINLASPAIVATLTIQEVTITEIDIAKNLAPRFTVKASSVRFSLEDTLRRLIAGGLTTVNA